MKVRRLVCGVWSAGSRRRWDGRRGGLVACERMWRCGRRAFVAIVGGVLVRMGRGRDYRVAGER